MRLRTAVAAAAVVAVLTVALVVAVTGATGGTLSEAWVSDTARDNEVNHHAVGASPDGRVVVAPVMAVPNSGVDLTPQSCSLVRLDRDSGAVRWRATVPPEDCFTHALTQPAVADVDGDGRTEVAVSTTQDALVVYDGVSGREQWRVPLSTYGYGRPTVGTLTAASGQAIVTSDIDGTVVAAAANGTVLWRVDLNRTVWDGPSVWDAPAVADVDADGTTEVVVASNDGTATLGPDGRLERLRNGSATYLATVDADGDPALEVVAAGDGQVRAVDGATGERAWRRDLSNPRVREAADVDGSATVFVGTAGGTVHAIDAATGETVWTARVVDGDATVTQPVVGDVDGDGGPEVVAVANTGTVAVLDAASGDELAAYEREVPVWTFATTADADGDGRPEILVRYGDGRVVTLDYES